MKHAGYAKSAAIDSDSEMNDWNPSQYLTFFSERIRPAIDLVAQIRIDPPRQIVDIGCGPGNSTQILRNRWPDAFVLGVDHSREMIDAAIRSFPEQAWLNEDIVQWKPEQPCDLVFSNAALHWLPDHRTLVRRLFSHVASGGALAFQIPSAVFPRVRTLIHDISHDERWSARMDAARTALTMETPGFYYDSLVDVASGIDIWETENQHVLPSKQAIVEWICGTGLRPFLTALASDVDRGSFLTELQRRVDADYPLQADGKVLFPFRRTFVIAYH